MHIKKALYGIHQMISEFGGIMKVMDMVVRFFVTQIGEYLFLLIMIKKMYFAKTVKNDVF